MTLVTAVWRTWTKIRSVLERLTCLAALLTRITIAQVFISSGWGKLHDLPHVVEFFTQLGIPKPELQAPFVAGTELVCGILLLVGLFTRLASIPLIVSMIVATLTARRAELSSFNDLTGFIEYLYIVLMIWLVIEGAGMLSLDYLLARKIDAQLEVGSSKSK